MPLGLILFAIFIGIPLLEIAAFVVIGGEIGLGWTLALVVITAVIGSALLRQQSFAAFQKIQSDMDAGRLPGEALGTGAMILIAGILLLTPGFVTDTIGFALFIPAVRRWLWHIVRSRIKVRVMRGGRFHEGGFNDGPRDPFANAPNRAGHQGPDDGPTIELDEDNYERRPNPDSPWRDKGPTGREPDVR